MHSCSTETFGGIKTASFSKNEASKNPGIPPFYGITADDAASRKMMPFLPRIQNGIISAVMPKRAGKRWNFDCIKTASKRHHTGFAYRHHHASTPYRKGVEMMQAGFCGVVLQAWIKGVIPPARDFRNAPCGSGWPLGAASERDRPPARSDAQIPAPGYISGGKFSLLFEKAKHSAAIVRRVQRFARPLQHECTLANGLASSALHSADLPGHPLRRETPGCASGVGADWRTFAVRAGTHERSPFEVTRNPKIFCNPHMRPLEA